MIDYLIVGSGLAGTSFAEYALQKGKAIFVFDNYSQNASRTAGGLYNPVILKRFSEVWEAEKQLDFMGDFYEKLGLKIPVKFNFEKPILRKFFSIEEQNNWFIASDKKGLSSFLSPKLIFKNYQGIPSPFGYGEVLRTGYMDTTVLLDNFQNYLIENNLFCSDKFIYENLLLKANSVAYNGIEARHIIFAEGFGMHANPYFIPFLLPLDGTKGELLIIKAPDLALDVIVNTSIFILPLGNSLFKVGATYDWKDKTDTPTEAGKKELEDKIKEVIDCDFEIVSHFAGVRPTVRDRKPLVGTHPTHKNVHLLNGLGTRGVMLGPAMAKALYDKIENNIPLNREIDITRFINKMG